MIYVHYTMIFFVILFIVGFADNIKNDGNAILAISGSGICLTILFGYIIYGYSTSRETHVLVPHSQYEITLHRTYVEFIVNEELSIKSKDYSIVSNPQNCKIYLNTFYNNYGESSNPELEIVPSQN